ncbi:MAG: hypothetical protein EHM61_26305 [Acidobacteria bacterium]|nr:MAG: hypothetical protein EHM61_26305 [Acidobacteriota bacterium]
MGVVLAAPPDAPDGSRTGNILLREYFLQRYLELHGERDLFPSTTLPEEIRARKMDPMAERFVEVQVDQFIDDVEQKLGAMKSDVAELESVRREAVSARSTDAPAIRARVRDLAKNVGDRAEDLFNMVAIVAIELQPKNGPRPSSGSADFLENELKFLEVQVGKAEARLKALFLAPTHTVGLDELRGDNVLTELKAIEQVSNDIKKKTAP